MSPRPSRHRIALSATVGAAIALAIACGPVRDVPVGAPRNACPAFPCSAYTSSLTPPNCGEGVCVVNGQINPILAISLSDANYFGPASLAITYTDLLNDAFHALAGKPPPCLGCVVLPGVVSVANSLTLLPQVGADVGYALEPAGARIVVPSNVRYRPLWQPAGTATFADAMVAGLPLLPIDAHVAATGGNAGPANTPTYGWSTTLMPGVYERTIQPVPPFDAIFPPIVRTITLPNDERFAVEVGDVDDKNALEVLHGLRIVRDGPESTLEGWTVYLRDSNTGQRVSQIVTLHDATIASTFRLHTLFNVFPGAPAPRTQTVLSPPASAAEGIPVLINNNLPGTGLAADAPIDNPLHYPALPRPVYVTGTVGVATGAAVDADLFIQESSLVTTNPNDRALHAIHYSTRTRATAGAYGVSLPPGVFDVYVVPSASSPFSATATKLEVADSPSGHAAGKDLPLLPRTLLSGTCLVDDGRPLSFAEVYAQPAALLAGVVDPTQWPRAAQTTTDANGFFSMSLDQGTYDVVVRPAEGSALPWTVTRSHKLTGDPVGLGVIKIPPPYLIDLTLLETTQANSFATHAVVRAYAFAPGSSGASSGGASGATGGSAIEIGQALADEAGHFRMFLTPLQ